LTAASDFRFRPLSLEVAREFGTDRVIGTTDFVCPVHRKNIQSGVGDRNELRSA